MAEGNACDSDGSDFDVDDMDDVDVNMALDEPDENNNDRQEHGQGDGDRQWMDALFADDSDTEGFDVGWREADFTEKTIADCRLHAGPTVVLPPDSKPHHYFELFWGDNMWERLTTETNR